MADTVRYLLEEMVPELEDMEQRGYFSKREIKQIVQKRQDFEYSLKRRAALKEDYLRYIEYESRLEELRQHRRRERGITGKKSLADYCITRRIHFIYERATRKFRGDLSLWSRWLRFCQRTGSARQMSRSLTKALQLHPTAASLWTYAAAWEFEHNLNAAAARALMQRGIRMCKDAAPSLWHEYFRMELLYALRLRERRRVLGIADGSGAAGEENGGEEGEGDESAAAVAAVLNGAVAAVVYRSAVKTIPGSVAFRRKFLDILRPLDFPGKQALEDLVYSSVADDFGNSPQAWDLRARRQLEAAPAGTSAFAAAEQAAISVYEEAVQAVPSAEMFALFAGFLGERLEEALEAEREAAGGAAQGAVQARGVALAQRLLQLYEQAAESRQLTEGVALAWPKLHLRCGDPGAAVAAARAAAQALPSSAAVWRQLATLEACQLAQQAQQASADAAASGEAGGAAHPAASSDSSSEDEGGAAGAALAGGSAARRQRRQQQEECRQLEKLVLQAVQAVGVEEGPPLWLAGLQALVGSGASLDGLCKALVETVAGQARGPVEGGMGAVAAAVLAAVQDTAGLQAARELYRQLLRLPPAGGELMHAVLGMELLAAESGGDATAQPLQAKQLRELFEAAVDAYGGQDWWLWLRYLQYQQQHGKGAGQVYWRAVKALDDPEPFVTECQLLKLQQ